jgi:hypothetical protein
MALNVATAASWEAPAPHGVFLAVEGLLDELGSVLMTLAPDTYVARPAPNVSGSIGEHVRHALDHIAALVASEPCSPLSYDHRERGTAVESDPSAALRQTFRLKAAIERWSARPVDEPIQVLSTVAASGESVAGWSTVGREVAFVLGHTIHHQAFIALLLDMQGLGVPERFGYAPSTPRAIPELKAKHHAVRAARGCRTTVRTLGRRTET